jgi:hypothetical protein
MEGPVSRTPEPSISGRFAYYIAVPLASRLTVAEYVIRSNVVKDATDSYNAPRFAAGGQNHARPRSQKRSRHQRRN